MRYHIDITREQSQLLGWDLVETLLVHFLSSAAGLPEYPLYVASGLRAATSICQFYAV
jgi:hypothetical protein